MKNGIIFIVAILIFTSVSAIAQISVMNFPMKDYHVNAIGKDLSCISCHEETVPSSAPDDKKCIECHGGMKDVAELTKTHDRNPHASNHYMYNIECVVCHSEHKPSKALCNECHKYKYPKLN